jgi:hypothetical protein
MPISLSIASASSTPVCPRLRALPDPGSIRSVGNAVDQLLTRHPERQLHGGQTSSRSRKKLLKAERHAYLMYSISGIAGCGYIRWSEG